MSLIIFYILFSIALLSEGSGIGILLGRNISYYTLLMSPLILFGVDWYQKKPITLPKWINYMFLGFLGANIISTFFSWYPKISLEFLLWYISAYLFFVYAYNRKEEIQRYIIQFIFAFSFFFTAYSVFLQFFGKGKLFFISLYGFNFAYSLPMESISHNHLGDFLVLPLLYCFYQIIHKKGSVLYVLCSMLFLPFFFLSYSRSAYLSLAVGMVVTIVTKFKSQKAKVKNTSPHFVLTKSETSRGKQNLKVENDRTSGVKWLLLIFFLFLFFFSFVIVGDKKQIKPIANIRQFLVQKTGLQTKFLTGNRITYALQAFNSMKENFWWGVGPGNYLLISYKYPPYPPYHKSETSHNILTDVFGESGGVAGVFFIMIIILILYYGYGYEARFVNRKSAINSNNEFRNRHTIRASSPLPTNISPILFVFFIAMLVNFQFDYTFHIYSFFIFFFVIGGLICEENSKGKIQSAKLQLITKSYTIEFFKQQFLTFNFKLLTFFYCSLFFIGISMLASQYALKNKNYELAIFFYPLNHVAWQKQIPKNFISGDRQKGNERLASFEKIAGNNHIILFSIGDMYFRSGQPKKGLEVFKKVVQFNPENKELKDFIVAQQ